MQPTPPARITGDLIGIFATYLKLDATEVAADANYFELGGDSLSTVSLAEAISSNFGIEFSLLDIFENPTPEALAAVLGTRHGISDAAAAQHG